LLNTTLGTYLSDNGSWFTFIFVLLCFSAIFSGYEVAFFSQPQNPEEDGENNKNGFVGRSLRLFHAHPKQFIATLLISNNLANIATVVLSATLLSQFRATEMVVMSDALWAVVDVVLITSMILFFGEITPKIFATYRRKVYIKYLTFVIRGAFSVFWPMSWLLARSSRLFHFLPSDSEQLISHDEIRRAIEMTPDTDSPREEKQILKALVNLGQITVRAIMRARVDVKAIEVKTTVSELISTVAEYGYSRVPVYENSLDEVRGVLYIKDLMPLLRDPNPSADWHRLMREPYFVPENKKINKLLNEFKEKKLHIAIVVDEYGGTAGIVTLEDILEEIFGEIGESGDQAELAYSKLSDTEFVFDAKMPLLDICRISGLEDRIFDEVKGETDSLGGLILELHGQFPQRGFCLRYKNFEFTIEAVTATHIKRVKLTVLPDNPSEQENSDH